MKKLVIQLSLISCICTTSAMDTARQNFEYIYAQLRQDTKNYPAYVNTVWGRYNTNPEKFIVTYATNNRFDGNELVVVARSNGKKEIGFASTFHFDDNRYEVFVKTGKNNRVALKHLAPKEIGKINNIHDIFSDSFTSYPLSALPALK